MNSKKLLSIIMSVLITLGAFNVFAADDAFYDVLNTAEETIGSQQDTSNEDAEAPAFDSLEFFTGAFESGAWVKGSTYSPDKLEYDLPIKKYSTSSIMLQSGTKFDSDKYVAYAEYKNEYGEDTKVEIISGKMTTFANQPFDSSVMTITIADKENPDIKTVYTFNITRPRDDTKKIKNSGIAIEPAGRELSQVKYGGIAEGAMQKSDETGTPTSGIGVTDSVKFYRTFLYDDVSEFLLNVSASTKYAHVRISTDGRQTWSELAQGGGISDRISVSDKESVIVIQITDDFSYNKNITEGNDGFFECEPDEYVLYVGKVTAKSPIIATAEVSDGDMYPAFKSDRYSYMVMVAHDASEPELKFTVPDGCSVKVGDEAISADESGEYSVTLATTAKKVTVVSDDGSFSNTYDFAYKKKSALDVPDKVVDYLCIGSQYTNKTTFGAAPEQTLGGTLRSLGNFGGYITYYYDKPITDNPNNKYGMDFYITGNSSENNIDSMAELGQVYVSEDGEKWYALAGSEHYETDKAVWDYTITYTRGDDGNAYWTDNKGNTIDYAATTWPSGLYYTMNNVPDEDTYTFTGIAFKSQLGNITGNGTTGAFAASAKFGYTDYYASNVTAKSVTDVNSYVEKPSKANGFDLAWAVDDNGIPIDVSDKEFHYIKVATASNIFAGAFREKSTEVTYVVRTAAQENAVGKTAAPTGVTLTDGAKTVSVAFDAEKNVYSVNVGDMKYISIKADGVSDSDNIYINNKRTVPGTYADGFTVTDKGETLVRIIVQNGDCEPDIKLLRLTGSAKESSRLIESIKLNVNGTIRTAETADGVNYNSNVGHKIDKVSIFPVSVFGTEITINGKTSESEYTLEYGENKFEISAAGKDGSTENAVLVVKRSSAPSGETSSKITVTFTLLGDEKHGDSEVHTYKNNKKTLPVWIPVKSYTVESDSTVLDVFEKALNDAGLSWTNDGGNYISEINGLAEFDNGSLSGWMYFLNGKHGDLGVAEQTLGNNDRIIFHYTDDYTAEQGSERWTTSSSDTSNGVYTVKFVTNGGSTVDSVKVNKNKTVSEPTTPIKDGYKFGGWYSDPKFKNEYNFDSKVTRNITLYTKWIENDKTNDKENDNDSDSSDVSFGDVRKDSPYAKAVEYVVRKKLFNGVSKSEFAPDNGMTRAMLVTVLYRLDGEKSVVSVDKFEDVAAQSWYSNAVAWAAENGIVNGIGDKIFNPDGLVTREQAAAILYRYAKAVGKAADDKADLSVYSDYDSISPWASEALCWTVSNGIISGTDSAMLLPSATATRAQLATILMRYCEK